MANEMSGGGKFSFSTAGTASMRVNLAVPHLLSATTCSRKTRELEIEHEGEMFGPFWEEILAQATAAVMIAVAGLESYANELFIDHEQIFPELRVDVVAKLWELYERKPILDKFELALLLKQARSFNHGARPYQDVEALVKLRNGLVHFKPEWFNEQEEDAKLSNRIKPKIESSRFVPSGPLFPLAWAGSSWTMWAVRSVIDFISEFERRVGIDRIRQFIDRIRPHVAQRKRQNARKRSTKTVRHCSIK